MRRALAFVRLGLALAGAGGAAVAPLAAQQPAPSRWWDEVEAVDALLRRGEWEKADHDHGALRRRVMASSWREPDLGQVLSELAFQAAVLRAEGGDDEEAVWEWHAAQAHERVAGPARGGPPLLERDLAPYGGRPAELLAAHPLRRRGDPPGGEEAARLGPLQSHEPVEVPDFELRPLQNESVTRSRVTPVVMEVYIDRAGRLREPVVTSTWTNPVIIQWGLDNLRRLPSFGPARIDGEPVGVLETIELELGAPVKF